METPVLRSYPFDEIVALARAGSPFYREAYANLPAQPTMHQLPVVDSAAYWQAHTADRRNILTGPLEEGNVFNSGGSTGAPKFLYCTSEEWDSAAAMTARSFDAAGLRDGDRVANLFAAGNLYASFLHATRSLKASARRTVHFPIGYFGTPADAARFIRLFDIQVLAGMPTYLASIVDHLVNEGVGGLSLRLLLFAGEPFTPDQRAHLQAGVAGLEICSAGYASVDAGPMGHADSGCGPGEHRVYDGASILEILDEATGEPIEETGRPGRLVLTSLTRRLMPMLRYPSGDRAEWLEPAGGPERLFMLLGRAEELVRVATVSLSVPEVRLILEPFWERFAIKQFQLLVTRVELHDLLTLRLVGEVPAAERAAAGEQIVGTLHHEKPLLDKLVAGGTVERPRVEWITAGELMISERTGKMLTIIDRRNLPPA